MYGDSWDKRIGAFSFNSFPDSRCGFAYFEEEEEEIFQFLSGFQERRAIAKELAEAINFQFLSGFQGRNVDFV